MAWGKNYSFDEEIEEVKRQPDEAKPGIERRKEKSSNTHGYIALAVSLGTLIFIGIIASLSYTVTIPGDVTYTIIDKNIVPGIKRSLTIRLNRKVSEGVLKSIAMKLKNSDPKTYERTFIGYYLPDMKVNAGCWATTHFNPKLEVRILGLTAKQEEALRQQTADPSREIIGVWLDERPFGGGRITIFRKDGGLFMENTFKDGSAGTVQLVETRSQSGRRFDYKPDRQNGEYYLINTKGELQELDQDGPFMTAKKVN